MDTDELAEINGIRPKVLLRDGDEREVSSMTSNAVYKIKRTMDHFYCTCPAWRNQGGAPVNARSCKHIKELLGDDYEVTRIKFKNPGAPSATAGRATKRKAPAKRPQAKRKRQGDDADEEDEDINTVKRKRARGSASKSKVMEIAVEENDEDEDGGDEDEDESSGKKVPELLLAIKWDLENGIDPTGWWISEKLDGVRTYFDGKMMISRLGNPFTPPPWFLDKLPKDVTLDGELFTKRGDFQSTVSIVKAMHSPHWQNVTFQIFDVPSLASKPFEERIEYLKATFGPEGPYASKNVVIVEHELATSRQHVLDKLKEIETLGGEGLMLRKAGSLYEGRRSSTLMKIKTFYDAEAVIIGYLGGKGRNKGVTGSLKCRMASGKTFNVGTGLSDKLRKNPPKIGAIITYRFQELTRDGVPRFPSYIGEAVDKDEPKDAEIPKHRIVNDKGKEDA